ncbi:MAG: T9SS type A sorting domain-containing protein [Bacteroidia bacterium]|nr:T9SS type A sorting domain-containing protein [Bacteroidia bacterium]
MLKKSIKVAAAALLLFNAVQAQRNCGTMQHLQTQLDNDPAMRLRMEQIEQQTQDYLLQKNSNSTQAVVTIPVVFHVLYNVNNATQNVSDARIMEQLNVINLDFSHTNADAGNAPAPFLAVAANTNIQFCLAQRDPNGAATTGIIRKQTSVTSFTQNNNVKFNSTGGADAWPVASYMNVWVCQLGSGLLGYAQFPGGTASTDGIVVLNGSVGGPAAPGTSSPYHLGRTLTHEVGHWLNLRHIWGDANCGNDLVNDTPTQQTSNGGCPSYPHVTCSNGPNGDMFNNYMDYVNDNCMNMFTAGQSARSNALFAPGGARVSLTTSQGCVPVGGGCGKPTGLAASGITSSGATLTWAAVSGATSYNFRYRLSPSGSWVNSTVTTNSKTLTGLSANTLYDYRVRAVCSVTGQYSAIAQFTTLSGGGCSDNYEPNNGKSVAKPIAINTNINAIISSATDKDWLTFTTTNAQPKLQVVLDQLPDDYDLKLYNSAGTQIANSQNGGTTAETINYNGASSGSTYTLQVYGYNGVFNAACYRLRVNTSATNFRITESAISNKANFSMYPNPANALVTINLFSDESQDATINLIDITGRVVYTQTISIAEGDQKMELDINQITKGIYFLQLNANGDKTVQKLVIEK